MVKLKESIKLIVGILIGILLGLCISVSAATLIASNNVTYSNTNTSAKDVKSALDDLYKKYNETKPLCKKATKLHYYICGESSCGSYGEFVGDEVRLYFGQLPLQTLKSGGCFNV